MLSRKGVTIAILSILAMLLSACGGDGADSTTTSATDETTTSDASQATTTTESGGEAPCEPAYEVETVSEGILTVVPYEFLPYASVEGDELGGVDGLVITEIAERLCLDLEILTLPAASALEAVETSRADLVLGGWYITEERGEQFGQTSPVYFDFVGMVSREEDGFSTLEDIADAQIAVVQGALFVEDLQELFGEENVTLYQTPDAAVNDVEIGRADVFLGGSGEGGQIVSQKEGLVINQIEPDPALPASTTVNAVNYPHALDAQILRDALNSLIEDLRGDGTVQAALEEYGLSNPANFEVPAS